MSCAAFARKTEAMPQAKGKATSPESGREGFAPAIVHEVLSSAGEPLSNPTRSFFESRLGHDFSRVRIHNDARAAESARAVNARAYTVGRNVVLGPGAPAPEEARSRELLAHELVHTVQQDGRRSAFTARIKVNHPDDEFEQEARRFSRGIFSSSISVSAPRWNMAKASPPALQRDIDPIDDPTRYKKIHESLFVPPSSKSTGGSAPSGSPPAFDAAAQALVKQQLTDPIKDLEQKRPGLFAHDLPQNTSQSDAEASAKAMDAQLRKFYPQIAAPLPLASFLSHVHIMTDAKTSSADYLKQWLAERLEGTDIAKYELKETDKAYQDFLTDLLSDSYLGSKIPELARHKGAYIETTAGVSDVYLNQGLSANQREPTLLHELVHYYAHPSFRVWVDATVDPRVYSEGFTEYLARKAMTADQLAGNGNPYQNRVDRIQNEVVKFVSDDDIARAFFTGEVWLLEGKSKVAKKALREQTGIDPEAKRTEENKASHSTEGIIETVAPGERYRFMNLGNEDSQPKAEHVAAFDQIYQKFIQKDSTARIKFVGHASSPGTVAFNNDLSLKRSKAFYQMARDAGVPESQLVAAKSPPHFGKSQLTAGSEDVQARAFNRRVELFITHVAAPANTAPQTTPSQPTNGEKDSPPQKPDGEKQDQSKQLQKDIQEAVRRAAQRVQVEEHAPSSTTAPTPKKEDDDGSQKQLALGFASQHLNGPDQAGLQLQGAYQGRDWQKGPHGRFLKYFEIELGILQPTVTLQLTRLWPIGAGRGTVRNPLPPPDTAQLGGTVSLAVIKAGKLSIAPQIGAAASIAGDVFGTTSGPGKSGGHVQALGVINLQIDYELPKNFSITATAGFQGGTDFAPKSVQQTDNATTSVVVTYHIK